MLVTGEGGSGKSTLLNAITSTFKTRGVSHLLAKTAMSGVAASLVGGSTLHWFVGLPSRSIPQSDIWPDNANKKIKERRKNNLCGLEWLAIDEAGMCTLDLLTLLSQVAGKSRIDNGTADSTVPFGGLNILLMGDFHQFPPVGNSNAALYCSPPARNTAVVGKSIYLQFNTVIDLNHQKRITDTVWNGVLQKVRVGNCSREDLDEIRKLILTNPGCRDTDFTQKPWADALLVTPRNSVRSAWNRASLRKHCANSGQVLYICDAEDTVGSERSPPNMLPESDCSGYDVGRNKETPSSNRDRDWNVGDGDVQRCNRGRFGKRFSRNDRGYCFGSQGNQEIFAWTMTGSSG